MVNDQNVVYEDAKVWGVLEAERHQLNDKNLGTISVDLIHSQKDASVTYNEISIRYLANNTSVMSKKFEELLLAQIRQEMAKQKAAPSNLPGAALSY